MEPDAENDDDESGEKVKTEVGLGLEGATPAIGSVGETAPKTLGAEGMGGERRIIARVIGMVMRGGKV